MVTPTPEEIFRNKELLPDILRAARLYKDKLLETSILIIAQDTRAKKYEYIEACFWKSNFMHLAGCDGIEPSKFFDNAIESRLAINSFISKPEARLKLDVLPILFELTKTAKMIGDFNGQAKNLWTEKLAGSAQACMGFVKDEESGIYVPNTALKEDARNMIKAPLRQILAIYQKPFGKPLYPITPQYICKALRSKADSLVWPKEIAEKIERI